MTNKYDVIKTMNPDQLYNLLMGRSPLPEGLTNKDIDELRNEVMEASKVAEKQIRDQIKVYEQEIENVNNDIRMCQSLLHSASSERSDIGGPGSDAMHASISAREQKYRTLINQVESRLPQLNFELKRLRAMLNE